MNQNNNKSGQIMISSGKPWPQLEIDDFPSERNLQKYFGDFPVRYVK